ncbi:MAG: Uma2 family endonuclease [Bryobacteraceae bacterium]
MQLVLNEIEPEAQIVIVPERRMTEDEYWDFCQANPDLRIERTADGEIEIMPPTGIETSCRNNDLSTQLGTWTKRDGRGRAFDSNAEFILPNGAARSPDASWIERSKLNKLTRQQKRKFGPLSPDFVIELMSPSDRLKKWQAKMREYIENGVALGWLLDPDKQMAYVYREGRDVDRLIGPEQLAGEGPVEGFVLDLKEIWDPDL